MINLEKDCRSQRMLIEEGDVDLPSDILYYRKYPIKFSLTPDTEGWELLCDTNFKTGPPGTFTRVKFSYYSHCILNPLPIVIYIICLRNPVLWMTFCGRLDQTSGQGTPFPPNRSRRGCTPSPFPPPEQNQRCSENKFQNKHTKPRYPTRLPVQKECLSV